jgi:hypothetical protein
MLHVKSGLGDAPVKLPVDESPAGNVRSLQPSDIPGVAQLFQTKFRDARRPAPAWLPAYLEEIFLNHPWQDGQQTSRVIVDGTGAVAGFIGVMPQRLLWGTTVVRTSVLGSLMSREPQRNPLVGAKLLRSALNGSHDLSLSESANRLSLKMWEKSGGITLPLHSLSWIRVLRPVSFPFAMLAENRSFFSAITPVPRGLDRLAQAVVPSAFAIASDGPQAESYDVGPDEFAAAVPALCTRYCIKPLWDEQILTWLLRHAATKGPFDAAVMRLVKGKGNRVVGGYIQYGKRYGVASVLQLFAIAGAERLVVDNMLTHAAATGFAAVRGRVQPEFLDSLVRQRSLMFRRAATVIHTRDQSLRALLLGEGALITGLAAEGWSKLMGE